MTAHGWMPIETAPRDGEDMLLWVPHFGGTAIIGRWDNDRYAVKPIPRWVTQNPVYGRRDLIIRPPTHWQPLPPPPTA